MESGYDRIGGDAGDDFVRGGEGDDTLRAGDGSDYVDGGSGDDWLVAGWLPGFDPDTVDVLHAGPGNDRLFGKKHGTTVYFGREGAGCATSL